MQTFKDKQQQFFKWDHLPEETLRRLDADWCGIWQREIMPMIDESLFSGQYCADDGRPSKATADMVGILILKDKEDLTDEETVIRCPRGVEPLRVKHTKKDDTVVAVFDKETCRACDMRGECGAKRHKKNHVPAFTRSRMATALRREHEKTEAF